MYQDERALQISQCGTYRTATGRQDLADAFERLLPTVWHLLDVPDEYLKIGRGLSQVLDGSWVPDVSVMSESTQLAFAIPMLNALRLTYENTPREERDGFYWAAFCTQVQYVFTVMGGMDPYVSWVAIRNCWARESKNLPSRNGVPFDGMSMITEGHLTQIDVFMDIYLKIMKQIRAYDRAS